MEVISKNTMLCPTSPPIVWRSNSFLYDSFSVALNHKGPHESVAHTQQQLPATYHTTVRVCDHIRPILFLL